MANPVLAFFPLPMPGIPKKMEFFNPSLLSHKRVGNGCFQSQIFLANRRPQLTFDHLFQEVFIRQLDVPRHQVVAM